MRIVTKQAFDEVVLTLHGIKNLGLDTETEGLLEKHRLFSIQIASEDREYYFNFNPNGDPCLPREYITKMNPLWKDKTKVWFIQNAKFDMGMLAKEGVELAGVVHCTKTGERLIKNNYFGGKAYGLAAMAKRRGLEKDPKVDEYVTKNRLYTDVEVMGKKFREKHFDQVPFEVMGPYGGQDARLHYICGKDQMFKIHEMTKDKVAAPILDVYHNELRLTKTCFKMERHGILVDVDYCKKAIEYERSEIDRNKAQFVTLTGRTFVDSNKALKEVFDHLNLPHGVTDKGNPSFDKDSLDDIDHPVVNTIKEIRRREKYINTYYLNYLYMVDDKNVIRANADQAATETGRFAYNNPNLTNVPSEEREDLGFYVRKSFVPRPDKLFVSIDYKQAEYRVLADYANEVKLIERINDGEDVHQATADILGISRKHAKTLGFGLLYGMGTEKLSKALGVRFTEARDIKRKYFSKLPGIKKLMDGVQSAAISRGYITNWFGRRLHLKDKDFAYIMLNHLIQSSAADMMKKALVDIDEKISIFPLVCVHDEGLFEMQEDQMEIIPKIRELMSGAYLPKNGTKIETDVSVSRVSWGYPDMGELSI